MEGRMIHLKFRNNLLISTLALISVLIFTTICSAQKSTGCYLSGSPSAFGTLRTTTGDARVDEAAAEEVVRLRAMFGVNPGFRFITDGNAPNAYATSEIQEQGRPDGTVLFGLSLHHRELAKSPGGTPIPMIMAHEFGHILAFKNGLEFGGKYNELFADFVAGSYMFFRKDWKPTNIDDTLRTFFEIGDYVFNSPQHHGTPKERYSAVLTGYQVTEDWVERGNRMEIKDLLGTAKAFIESQKRLSGKK